MVSSATSFPPAATTTFRVIVADTLTKVQAGDQAGATARIKDLETAWDDAQSTLQPMDDVGWSVLDGQIDTALEALRADRPDPAAETRALTTPVELPRVNDPPAGRYDLHHIPRRTFRFLPHGVHDD